MSVGKKTQTKKKCISELEAQFSEKVAPVQSLNQADHTLQTCSCFQLFSCTFIVLDAKGGGQKCKVLERGMRLKRVEEGADHLFPVFSQLQAWHSYFC